MQRLQTVMRQAGLDQWGVCGFEQILPLRNVRSKGRVSNDIKSVIVILFGYYIGEYPNRNISRYAIVDDYHVAIRQKLEDMVISLKELYKNELFLPFVDSSPVDEVRAAYLAGLGEIGMNGQLLNSVYGSYCFIGEILTTVELAAAAQKQSGICSGCGRCIAACPTGALTGNAFDTSRCRSHITQKKGELSVWEREQIQLGGYVWGCDCCTDACPVNRTAKQATLTAFYKDIQPYLGKDNAGRLCATKAYGWRGEKLLLRNLSIISDEPPSGDIEQSCSQRRDFNGDIGT